MTRDGRKLNIDWDEQPLGQVFDTALAAELGVGITTVRRERNKREIPVCGLRRKVRQPSKIVDWDKQVLGQCFDKDIASELGVDVYRVSRARRDRGIPRFSRKKRAV